MTTYLLSVLIRSALLGSLGLVALRLIRRKPAAVQHAVAVATVCAMVALPAIGALLPAKAVEVARVPSALQFLATTRPGVPGMPFMAPTRSSAFDFESLAVWLWLAVAFLLWVRMGIGLLFLSRGIGKGHEIPLGRLVPVLEVEEAGMPMIVWIRRCLILLPKDWATWPKDRLAHVLAHEEAHASRGDWFSQVFVNVATAAMWPNPIAHVLARRVRTLAEHAADDVVLSSGVDPSGYASSLLSIARTTLPAPSCAIPMAAKANVAQRIEMILNRNLQRGAVTLRVLVVSSLLLLATSIPIACWALRQGNHGVAFGASTPLMILSQKDVQADLHLTGYQIQKVADLLKQMRQDLRHLTKSSPQGERNRIAGRSLGELGALLTSPQEARLRQIFVQWRKNDAILDPGVQAELDISGPQRARIERIAAEYQRANANLYKRLRTGGLMPDQIQPAQERINDAYEAGLGQVLTPAQASKLASMAGSPFAGTIQGTIWSQD